MKHFHLNNVGRLVAVLLVALMMPAKGWAATYFIAEYDPEARTLTFKSSSTAPQENPQGMFDPTQKYQWDATDTGDDYAPWAKASNLSKYGIMYAERIIIERSFSDARPKSCAGWFFRAEVKEIEGLKYLNTSEVTNMHHMFKLSYVTNLDLSTFDTGNVTNMSQMFGAQFEGGSTSSYLETLDVSRFNTSKVTNMRGMFAGCYNLTTLNVRSFDTSNVTDMNQMFSSCYKLETLDLSSFSTDKVTDMSYMFSGCSKLNSLDVSGFNTSKVTTMYLMFGSCQALTSLNLRNFDTGNVETFAHMFSNCNTLVDLNISRFNTGKATSLTGMFSGCRKLEKLDLHHFNTENVTTLNDIFWNCESLKSINMSGWQNTKVTNLYRLFFNLSNLEELNLSGFKTDNVTYMADMFWSCRSLKSLDLSSFNTSKVTDMSQMFASCSSLTSLDLSTFNTESLRGVRNMFSYCESLKKLDVSGWQNSQLADMSSLFADMRGVEELNLTGFNTSNATNMSSMFANCTSLKSLDLSGFDTKNVTSMSAMFAGCESLKSMDVSRLDTRNVTNMSEMFSRCMNMEEVILKTHLEHPFVTDNVTTMKSMFNECRRLKYVGGLYLLNCSKVTTFENMFYNTQDMELLQFSFWEMQEGANVYHMFYQCEANLWLGGTMQDIILSNFQSYRREDMHNIFYWDPEMHDVCDLLILRDDRDFIAVSPFWAKKVVYEHPMKAGECAAVTLPYDMKELPDGLVAYELSYYRPKQDYFVFNRVEATEDYQPEEMIVRDHPYVFFATKDIDNFNVDEPVYIWHEWNTRNTNGWLCKTTRATYQFANDTVPAMSWYLMEQQNPAYSQPGGKDLVPVTLGDKELTVDESMPSSVVGLPNYETRKINLLLPEPEQDTSLPIETLADADDTGTEELDETQSQTTTPSEVLTEQTMLENDLIQGILYTLATTLGSGYNAEAEAVEIADTISVEALAVILEAAKPGTGVFASYFNGLSFLMPAGHFTVDVDCKTLGEAELCVTIGGEGSLTFQQTEQGLVRVDYDCPEDTWMYISSVTQSAATAEPADADDADASGDAARRAPRRAPSEPGVVRIYSITTNGVAKGDVNADSVFDAADVMGVVNAMGTSTRKTAPDTNADGVVDAADVMKVVNKMEK